MGNMGIWIHVEDGILYTLYYTDDYVVTAEDEDDLSYTLDY